MTDLYTQVLRQIDRLDVDVSPFEAEFLDTNLKRASNIRDGLPVHYTTKQRKVIVRMAEKYLPGEVAAELLAQQRLFGR